MIALLPNLEKLPRSGCGAKAIGLVKQEGDLCLYSTGGSSRWDIGPMEIFMEVLGGRVTGIRGEKYVYEKKCHTNLFGLIACTNKQSSEEIGKKFLEYFVSIGKEEGALLGNEINKDLND